MDATPSDNNFQAANENAGFAMDIDTIFDEYDFMDPELSAAWDEGQVGSHCISMLIDTFLD
jgi:hypothetical protein